MSASANVDCLLRARPGAWSRVELIVAWLMAVAAFAVYLFLHVSLAPDYTPNPATFGNLDRAALPLSNWWRNWDQFRYLQASLAWSAGVLDPSQHWYLPGYPLIGAAFARITPDQPFLLPDLACLLTTLILFVSLSARLIGPIPHARAVAALVFGVTVLASPLSIVAWLMPWTTSPQTVCMLGALLATARFIEAPRARDAFLAALAAVTTAGFRPAEAAVVLFTCGVAAGVTLLRDWPGWRPAARLGAAAMAGASLPALLLGGAYVAVWGCAPSDYIKLSEALGFEWRLLAQRWVTLVIDPRPLFPDGHGLATEFAWVVPGVCGMAACLLTISGPQRRLHLLVGGTVLLDAMLLLSYRDLYTTGLWTFSNYHYFKWMLPVLGTYAVLLANILAARRTRLRGAAMAAAVVAALFMWRVELVAMAPLPFTTDTVGLPSGLPHMTDAVLAKAAGNWNMLAKDTNALDAGNVTFRNEYDFAVYLAGERLMILPLRPLPGTPGTLRLMPGTVLDPSVTPVLARQRLVWGLPCVVLSERDACRAWAP